LIKLFAWGEGDRAAAFASGPRGPIWAPRAQTVLASARYGVQSHHTISDPCSLCANGFFAPGGSNTHCTLCGLGAVTEPTVAASSSSNCQCHALAGLHSLHA
jgi:hypothetical protein